MSGRGTRRRAGETVQELRARIWERERGKCCVCRFPVALEHASIEHVNPLSLGGGRYGKVNRRISHRWCNSARGTGPLKINEEALASTKRAYHRFPGLTWFPGTEPPYGRRNPNRVKASVGAGQKAGSSPASENGKLHSGSTADA